MSQQWSLGNKKTNVTENNLYLEPMAQKILQSLNQGESEFDLLVWTSGWSNWKNFTEVPEICHEIDKIKIMKKEEPPPLSTMNIPPLPTSKPKIINESVNSKLTDSKSNTSKSNTSKSNDTKPFNSNQKILEKSIHQDKVHLTKNDFNSNSKQTSNTTNKSNSNVPVENINTYKKRQHNRIVARFKCIIRSASLTFRTFTNDISLGGVSLEDEIPSDLIGLECMIYISSTKTNKNLKFKIALTERCVAKYFSFQDADKNLIKELSDWLDDHQKLNSAS